MQGVSRVRGWCVWRCVYGNGIITTKLRSFLVDAQNTKYKTERKTGFVFCILSGLNKTEILKWNRNSIELTHPTYYVVTDSSHIDGPTTMASTEFSKWTYFRTH